MRKPADFATYKRLKRVSYNDFNRWITSIYQSGFDDGSEETELIFEKNMAASMDEDRFIEVVSSVPGVDRRRAEMILTAVLNEGNSYFESEKEG